jgi:peptidoglycan/LPS O-acetylase OafA/YrhL
MGLWFLRQDRQPRGPGPSESAPAGPPAAEGFRLGYRPVLDGLRGVSILLVLLVHTYPQWFPGGVLGVDVFFVLSGFLITALLAQEWQRTGAIDFKAFYLRRALRLLPALVMFVAALLLYTHLLVGHDEALLARKGAAGALLYYSNWRFTRSPQTGDLFLHTWSLSVEEQFYLLWPALLAGLLWLRCPRRLTLLLVGLGVAASAAVRAALLAGGTIPQFLYMYSHTRADSLLIGALVGLLACWDLLPRSPRARIVLNAAALAAVPVLAGHVLLANQKYPYLHNGGFTLVAAAVAVLLAALLCSPPRLLARPLEAPALVWLGRRSYGLYLWHFPIFFVVRFWLTAQREVAFVCGLRASQISQIVIVYAVSITTAGLSFAWVEQPFLRLKAAAPTPVAYRRAA